MKKYLIILNIIIVFLLALTTIHLVQSVIEPPPKCTIYFGDYQHYTQDIPCGQVYDWCEKNGCEKSSGNCGKPICFCSNMTKEEYYGKSPNEIKG